MMRSALRHWPTAQKTLSCIGLCLLSSLWGCAVPLNDPVPAPAASTLPARLALAFAYYQNGQYRVALEESRKVLEAQPEQAQAMGLQGLIYARLNETALAQRSFLRAEQGALQDPDIAHNHGVFLCEQQQYPASFERFRRALQQPLYAEKAKTLWVWGVCTQQSGDEAAAQALWEQSMAIAPSAQTALALTQIYQQQKQPLRAQDVLSQINNSTAASPQTLWLGIQWARKMADKPTVERYAGQLQKQFPTSTQWHAYQREAFDD